MHYLNLGFQYLKNATVTIAGVNHECIFDTQTLTLKRDFGFEEGDSCTIMVQSVCNPSIGVQATLNGKIWLVGSVRHGGALNTLTLVSPHA